MTDLSPWREDWSTLSAEQRQLACYGLRLVRDPVVVDCLDESDTLGALWELLEPLVVPGLMRDLAEAALAEDREESEARPRLRRGRRRLAETTPEVTALARHPEDHPLLYREVQAWLRAVPETLSRALETDAAALTPSGPLAVLGDTLTLAPEEIAILRFLEQRDASEALVELLREGGRRHRSRSWRINRERLAQLLGLPASTLRAVLHPQAPLRQLGLVECDINHHRDLEDAITASDLLRLVLEAEPADPEALLALLVEPAPAAAWPLAAFGHLQADIARIRALLHGSTAQAAPGVNLLFHGAPGTGKTELARAVAAECGLQAFAVCSTDEAGRGLSREGRLAAYRLAQRMLARRRDAVVLFDEVEDVFDDGRGLLALLGGEPAAGPQKGWMNRILEENPVPAIWITNRTRGMDPAFLRRFLAPVAFTTPPRSVRRQMAERHLGDAGLAPEVLDALAADAALTPAQLGAAARLVALCPEQAPEQTVRAGIGALRQLLQGAPLPWQRTAATAFDAAFLNLAGGVTPGAIVQALARSGRGTLCFAGPPGTGKTAFAEALAAALDRELVSRQASDLLSPYLGETEQQLAQLFRETDPHSTVLLLDEVDSFLGDRRQAQRPWERTQVNELLQQMERYPGIFVAATNLLSGIDAAALRRFDFKLQFRALTPAQRQALFAREALGDVAAPVPAVIARHLEGLEGLTAGDFATVCRQQQLLGEALSPEQFLRRLALECRLKGAAAQAA
ncbi:ATP-binding protein [Thiorhodococcus mannitoliphagus]|uniref:ATP-binding protein n=2 Tax=Thiorhodococcus mannitoliphagus TaxID=329406 RepID=A0A6P1E220_9GAMM|nr:ATP-binding protein [Thiorhodococcus mannitoliphagus]